MQILEFVRGYGTVKDHIRCYTSGSTPTPVADEFTLDFPISGTASDVTSGIIGFSELMDLPDGSAVVIPESHRHVNTRRETIITLSPEITINDIGDKPDKITIEYVPEDDFTMTSITSAYLPGGGTASYENDAYEKLPIRDFIVNQSTGELEPVPYFILSGFTEGEDYDITLRFVSTIGSGAAGTAGDPDETTQYSDCGKVTNIVLDGNDVMIKSAESVISFTSADRSTAEIVLRRVKEFCFGSNVYLFGSMTGA